MYLSQNWISVILASGRNYFVGDQGSKSCPAGSKDVTSSAECAISCANLNINRSDHKLMDRKPCYKGGQDVCNQDGYNGKGASLICKPRRNIILNEILHT